MSKILVLCEGPTEQRFVESVLYDYLLNFGHWIIATVVTTKVIDTGPNLKGGGGNYSNYERHILRLLGDSSAAAVTTMIDLYGLPSGFPCNDIPKDPDCYVHVSNLEACWAQHISHNRFLPYLQLHEIEALWLTDPVAIHKQFPEGKQFHLDALTLQLNEVDSPERLNDGPNTHPYKRITQIYPSFRKVVGGTTAALDIGIPRIKQACPHFANWLNIMETLH
jgi:hypothetical protein